MGKIFMVVQAFKTIVAIAKAVSSLVEHSKKKHEKKES